eukprot:1887191-Rhodomonas_salina.1
MCCSTGLCMRLRYAMPGNEVTLLCQRDAFELTTGVDSTLLTLPGADSRHTVASKLSDADMGCVRDQEKQLAAAS